MDSTYIALIITIICIIAIISFFLYISFNVVINTQRTMEAIYNRTISLSMNLSNNLTNSISIGTSIGDFVANLYNAVGIYDIVNIKYDIEFKKIYNMFTYWSANNDYSNILFRSDNYNENKLYTLPCYLADIYINSNRYMNMYEIFGEAKSFGYLIEIYGNYDNDNQIIKNTKSSPFSENTEREIFIDNNITPKLYITKLSNAYCRLELDDTPFIKYINKFFQFVYDTLISEKLNEEGVTNIKNTLLCNNFKDTKTIRNSSTDKTYYIYFDNNEELFEYYQYFIIIYKLKKEFYNAATISSSSNNAYEYSIYNYLKQKEYEISYKNEYSSKETSRFRIERYEFNENRLVLVKVYSK